MILLVKYKSRNLFFVKWWLWFIGLMEISFNIDYREGVEGYCLKSGLTKLYNFYLGLIDLSDFQMINRCFICLYWIGHLFIKIWCFYCLLKLLNYKILVSCNLFHFIFYYTLAWNRGFFLFEGNLWKSIKCSYHLRTSSMYSSKDQMFLEGDRRMNYLSE